jgi:branched-chain amino acid transport system substrate-binding protein
MIGKRTTATVLAGALLAGTAAVASAQSDIRIGVLLPYSGVFGGLGKDQDISLEMGFDDLGREVAGRNITLVKADTESKPTAGLAAVKALILRDKVDMVVGIVSSAVAGAVRDYVHGSQTPLLITNAGNDPLTGELCSPWILRTSFSNSQINRDMGPYMAGQGYKSAFLMAFDYAAGHQMMDTFKAGFTAAGGTIAGEAYPPLGETKDFGPYLAQAKAANPDLVYVFFAGGPAIKFMKEWGAFGMRGEVQLAGAGWLNSALYVNAQGMDAEGTLGILNYVPSIDTPANHVFQEKFRAAHGRDGSEFGVAAYDSARLIVEALKATGGNTEDKAALVAAMRDTSFDGPRGPFRIDPATNNVIQNVYIFEVQAQGDGVAAVVQDMVADVQDPPNGCEL